MHQIGGIVAGQRRAQNLRDAGLVEAKTRRAHAIDDDDLAWRIGLDAGIDIDDVRFGAELLFQRQRRLAHRGVIRSVNLGHDRREYRRTGRYFDQLDRRAELLADRTQLRAHGLRDRVALAMTLVLVDQIDLQVADQWPAAQVVLTHEAVEGDRSGGAGVGLPVLDFGHAGQTVGNLAKQFIGALERTAFRHVDDNLEF